MGSQSQLKQPPKSRYKCFRCHKESDLKRCMKEEAVSTASLSGHLRFVFCPYCQVKGPMIYISEESAERSREMMYLQRIWNQSQSEEDLRVFLRAKQEYAIFFNRDQEYYRSLEEANERSDT